MRIAGSVDIDGPLDVEGNASTSYVIFGINNATTTTSGGVLGRSDSNNGRGVLGTAESGTGVAVGVWGQSNSTTGRGVVGIALANSGSAVGVAGQCVSASGYSFFASGAGTFYGSSSSRRWKRNIIPIAEPLDMIEQLRGVYFDWIDKRGGRHDMGMIAEEVGAVVPEIVNYEANGIDASGMDYSRLTPLLIEAVKAVRAEKDAEIAALRAHNDALSAKLERLERLVHSRLGSAQP